MLAYGFKGIGKFAAVMLPWHFTGATTGLFSNANIYAIINPLPDFHLRHQRRHGERSHHRSDAVHNLDRDLAHHRPGGDV